MRFLFGFLCALVLVSMYPTIATDAFSGAKRFFVESGARDKVIDTLKDDSKWQPTVK